LRAESAAVALRLGEAEELLDRLSVASHRRTWVALVDGARPQIDAINAEAAARDVTVHIVVDFMHVMEYLRKGRVESQCSYIACSAATVEASCRATDGS